MSSPIMSGQLGNTVFPGLKKIFGMGMTKHRDYISEMLEVQSSSQAFEKLQGFAGLGLMKAKPEGQALEYDTMANTYEKIITHVSYSLGYRITREAIEDQLYPEVGTRMAEELARSAYTTRQIYAANVFNNAFSSSYLGMDSVALCSTAHVKGKDGSTYANRTSGGDDLSELVLETYCNSIKKHTDEAGNPQLVMPKKLLIPVELRFEAQRILGSTLQNDTANNATNAIVDLGVLSSSSVVDNPFFTDSDAFFILTDHSEQGLWIDRVKPELKDDTPDFDTMTKAHSIYQRFSTAWTFPYWVYGSPGV